MSSALKHVGEERLRLLIKHFRDELPRGHEIYEEAYSIGEREAANALEELLYLRNEVARITSLAVHLNSGGRDPDEKCYSKRDVEALIAITRAVEKKHG